MLYIFIYIYLSIQQILGAAYVSGAVAGNTAGTKQ